MTKKPIIRFKNYNEDWEQRKLGELLKYEQPTRYIVSSTAYDNEFDTPVLTAGQSFILGYTNEINGIKNASKNNPVIIFDDFTTSSHYVDFPFKVKSSAMKLLELKQNTDDFYFVYNILKNINYIPQTHERHWISIFSHFKVFLPTSSEQQKIGSFFKQIDNTITLHQRKIEALEKTKTSFLQKMFPKKDKTKPEIRFSGFTDDWEQRKLIEVSEMYNNLRIPVTASDRITGNTPYYGANGIQDYVDGFTHSGEYVLLAEDGANDLLNYPVHYVNGTVWVNNHAHVISGKSGQLYNLFLVSRMKSMNIIPWLVGGGRAKLNGEVLKKIPILLPSYPEQQKIGTFFKQLDDTIALHQRQLEALEMTKNSFLQKMFI